MTWRTLEENFFMSAQIYENFPIEGEYEANMINIPKNTEGWV